MAINFVQIGKHIGEIRKRRGLSQQKLAEIVNKSPTYVSYIEGGLKCMSLLDAGKDQKRIDEIGDAIISLREERQDILTEAAKNTELKERVDDLAAFLGEQTEALTEYSETLVRRLIEKITVYDAKLTVEFKSGLEIDVEA